MADQDLMLMTHPDIPDAEPATTTEYAFRTMWSHRGWERAAPAELAASNVLGVSVPDLDGLTIPQLREVAATLDLEILSTAKKAEIIEAIEAHTATATDNQEG